MGRDLRPRFRVENGLSLLLEMSVQNHGAPWMVAGGPATPLLPDTNSYRLFIKCSVPHFKVLGVNVMRCLVI